MPKKAKKIKLKTHRGAAKRFKVTATGKIKRGHVGRRHILGFKPRKRKLRLKKMGQVSKADLPNVREMLPYA